MKKPEIKKLVLISMALNFGAASSSTLHQQQRPLISPKHNHPLKLFSPSRLIVSSLSEGTEYRIDQDIIINNNNDTPAYSGPFTSARMQLDLLERLTSSSDSSSVDGYESDGNSSRPTIREQLANLIGECYGDFSIPLGKNRKKVVTAKSLTKSQKRNIKRKAYLNKVSQRNDWFFFATIGAFVIVPPLVILGIAIATGYVQLLP